MTIHQKALEILSFYSDKESVQETDFVSVLKNDPDIIKSLNMLYDTEIVMSVKSFSKVSSLLSYWGSNTSLDINEQSFSIQQRIDNLPFPYKYKTDKLSQKWENNTDIFNKVIRINIVKPINLYGFIIHFVLLLFLALVSQYGEGAAVFTLILFGIIQYVVLSIRFDISFNSNDNVLDDLIRSLGSLKVPVEDLLVPYKDLAIYYKKQRSYGLYVLFIAIVIIIGNMYPLFTWGDVAIFWGIPFFLIIAAIHIYVLGVFVNAYICSSKKIKAKIVGFEETIKVVKQKNQAASYEYSSKCNEESNNKQLYLLFDKRSRNIAEKIVKELKVYLSDKIQIMLSDSTDDQQQKEGHLENASVVLCLIDINFVKSVEVMQELVSASNLNKTIIAGRYPNTTIPSNLMKYIRREIHSLEEMNGYNSMVLEMLPLLGCSEPLADAVGNHYEIHVNSSRPYTVSFDDKTFNFTSSQILHLFFSKGYHNIVIYNNKDLIVTRMASAAGCSIKSNMLHYVDTIDLDSMILGRKEVLK